VRDPSPELLQALAGRRGPRETWGRRPRRWRGRWSRLVGHRALHDAADSSATARSIAPACSHSFARRTATTWRAAWPLARWRTSSPTTIPTFVGL